MLTFKNKKTINEIFPNKMCKYLIAFDCNNTICYDVNSYNCGINSFENIYNNMTYYNKYCDSVARQNINYIYQLTECGRLIETFNRFSDLENPMPVLTNGMFVQTSNNQYGVVVDDSIVYQDGGWDDLRDIDDIDIINIWGAANGFWDCSEENEDRDKLLLWSKEIK